MSNLLDKSSIVLTATAYDNSKVLCVKPSDGSGDFDFSRNSAATRVNAQGLVENVQILSSNLVQNGSFSEQGAEEISNGSFSQEGVEEITNGDFSSDTDWVKASGTTISDGKLNITANSTNDRTFQNVGMVQGKIYKLVLEVSNYQSGSLFILFGGSGTPNIPNITSNGTYTFYQECIGTNGYFYFGGNLFDGSIDNCSVREVGQDWTLENTWTIGDGVANGNGAVGSTEELTQPNTFTLGKTYKVVYEILNYVSGNIQFQFSGGATLSGTTRSANGTYTEYVVATANHTLLKFKAGSPFNGSITNISVKEVGQNWTLDDWSVGNSLVSSGNTSSLLRQDNIYTSTTSIYKTTFKAKSVNGTSVTLRVYDGSGNNFETITITSSNFQDFTLTRQRQGASPSLFFYNNSNAEIEITNISVIEITDDTNLPRINYEGFSFDGSGNIVPNSGCGSWLFESQSTNLITQSELFSDASWNASTDVIIDKGYLAPDGTNNATKVTVDGANPKVALFLVGTAPYTKSIYARTVSGTGTMYLGEGSISGVLSNVTEQWQRFEITNNNNNFYAADFRGASTLTEVIIWGAQFEQQSYATSYIPTSGSTVTRNQDVCTNGGSLATINSTEGTLYFEGSVLANTSSFEVISLSDGSLSNILGFVYRNVLNQFSAVVKSGGSTSLSKTITLADATDTIKVAVSYKLNDFKFYLNGVLIIADTSGNTPIGLNTLHFADGNGTSNKFFGKTKALAVWKEALSDAELTELTTI